MPTIMDELLQVERQGWDALSSGGGAGFYAQRLADDALMVVPGMVLSRDAALESMRKSPAWQWYRIDEPRAVELTDESAALVYRVTAQRQGAPEYSALVTSLYVRRNGRWLMALHHQTPVQGS